MTKLEQYLSAHDKLILNCLISFFAFFKDAFLTFLLFHFKPIVKFLIRPCHRKYCSHYGIADPEHDNDADNLIRQMRFSNVNISLTKLSFSEDGIPKIDLRTVNEMELLRVFNERQDAQTFKQMMDKCQEREGFLSKNDYERMEDCFDNADVDSDGFLNQEEFEQLIQVTVPHPSNKQLQKIWLKYNRFNYDVDDLRNICLHCIVMVSLFSFYTSFPLLMNVLLCATYVYRYQSENRSISKDQYMEFVAKSVGDLNPFLDTNDLNLNNHEDDVRLNITRRLRRKFVDQVINCLSSIRGDRFFTNDPHEEEYIFGVTFEKQNDQRNCKLRILLMERNALEDLYQIEEFYHDGVQHIKYHEYCGIRTKDLKLLWDLYSIQNGNVENDLNYIIGKVWLVPPRELLEEQL